MTKSTTTSLNMKIEELERAYSRLENEYDTALYDGNGRDLFIIEKRMDRIMTELEYLSSKSRERQAGITYTWETNDQRDNRYHL